MLFIIHLVSNILTPLSSFNYANLKEGTHEYFGQSIETTPIRTTSGLCYKVQSEATKFEYNTSFVFTAVDKIGQKHQVDKLEKMNLYVVSTNTWQGVIYGTWASTQNPLNIIGVFNDVLANSLHMYFVPIEVTEWAYINGNHNYSQCLEEQDSISKSCKSIFHPKSFKYESRSVFQNSTHFLIFLDFLKP